MSIPLKSLMSLSLAILLGISLSCDATAAQSREKARTNRQIEACIAEISRHADYAEASRVTHWVTSIRQENLVELRIVVDTTVLSSATGQSRAYHASCVTDSVRGVIDFDIATGQVGPAAANEAAQS